MAKSNLLRMRIEFEHVPIVDSTKYIKDEDEFDDLTRDIKRKLFGK